MEWKRPWEIKREGVYILHCTDDQRFDVDGIWNEPLMVKIVEELDSDSGNLQMVMHAANDMPCLVETLDSECRFFGPIPNLTKD